MKRIVLAVVLIIVVSAPPVWGAQRQRSGNRSFKNTGQSGRTVSKARSIRNRLNDVFQQATLPEMPARQALDWWSRATGINLVINWRGLEELGIDPQTPIDVNLRNVGVGQLLTIILRQLSTVDPMIYQIRDNYVEVLTKEQADSITETRVYDVNDLLVVVPNFDNAPLFDLNSALENTNSGGSGNSTSGNRGSSSESSSLFRDTDGGERELPRTRTQRGEELADLIRDAIEPEIWAARGGVHSSIRYYQGNLVVKAPRYVHDQIGLPTRSRRPSPSLGSTMRTTTYRVTPRRTATRRSIRPGRSNGVSGVEQASPRPVSGIGH